jgi:hypothetical protein
METQQSGEYGVSFTRDGNRDAASIYAFDAQAA